MSATVPMSVWNNVKKYFKEHLAFVLKAGAKVRALFLTTKLFRKFF